MTKKNLEHWGLMHFLCFLWVVLHVQIVRSKTPEITALMKLDKTMISERHRQQKIT